MSEFLASPEVPTVSDCLVSVLVAAHNSAAFLMTALNSALYQRGVDVEVIVVDDGSTDGTSLLLERVARGEPRLRILKCSESRGPSAARNLALLEARGEWIAILDSDDAMALDRLQHMVVRAREFNCDMLADNLRLIDFVTGQNLGLALDPAWMNNHGPTSLAYILRRDWPGEHKGRGLGFIKPIIKTSLIQTTQVRYDEDISVGEDLLFYSRLVDAGAQLYLQPEARYFYSVRLGSASSQPRAALDLEKVNYRISCLRTAKSSEVDFRERGHAFWYQQFSTAFKQGDLGSAFAAARRVPAPYIGRKIFQATARRL